MQLRRAEPVGRRIELALGVPALGHVLEQAAGRAQVLDLGREADAREQGLRIAPAGPGEEALEARQLADTRARPVERLGGDVEEDDRVSGAGEELGESAAHGPRAGHMDDLLRHPALSRFGDQLRQPQPQLVDRAALLRSVSRSRTVTDCVLSASGRRP